MANKPAVCEVVVDNDLNLICGREAKHDIKVRDRVTTAYVKVCDEHRAEHDQSAAALRMANKK